MPNSSTSNLYRVATNIRKWRTITGMKQGQLADELDISIAAMSKIETGKTDIPLTRLFAIAEALGIEVESMFSDPYSSIKVKNSSNPLSLTTAPDTPG